MYVVCHLLKKLIHATGLRGMQIMRYGFIDCFRTVIPDLQPRTHTGLSLGQSHDTSFTFPITESNSQWPNSLRSAMLSERFSIFFPSIRLVSLSRFCLVLRRSFSGIDGLKPAIDVIVQRVGANHGTKTRHSASYRMIHTGIQRSPANKN